MLESPESTVYPSGALAKAEVMNLSVVPEFSTFTMSSGIFGDAPDMRSVELSCLIDAPIALDAAMVALVSLDSRALETTEFPSARLAIKTARWV